MRLFHSFYWILFRNFGSLDRNNCCVRQTCCAAVFLCCKEIKCSTKTNIDSHSAVATTMTAKKEAIRCKTSFKQYHIPQLKLITSIRRLLLCVCVVGRASNENSAFSGINNDWISVELLFAVAFLLTLMNSNRYFLSHSPYFFLSLVVNILSIW